MSGEADCLAAHLAFVLSGIAEAESISKNDVSPTP
jgi:hypothetical protein